MVSYHIVYKDMNSNAVAISINSTSKFYRLKYVGLHFLEKLDLAFNPTTGIEGVC